MSKFVQAQLSLLAGESDVRIGPDGRVTSNTYGWIPDNRGFLRTYTGIKKILLAVAPSGDGPAEWKDKWVKDCVHFVDMLGRRRHVLVVDNELYSLDGVQPTLIFTYPCSGSIKLIAHNNHVIALNPNYPPIKYDGEAVMWLGVRDVPALPEVHSVDLGPDLATSGSVQYFETYSSWGATAADYRPPVFMQHDSATDPETRRWRWKIAFENARGQVGRWSASVDLQLDSSTGNVRKRLWPLVEWTRPTDYGPANAGNDICYALVARTGNTYTDPDAGAFFVQGRYPITQNHVLDNVGDAGLSDAINEDDYPPVNAAFGCVYKDIVLISGNPDDPYGVWHSKPGYMESWPQLNYYKARDVVTAVLPLSDRVVVVTETGIEVIVLTDAGNFALFRKEDDRGSRYGDSLVVYKDSIFGIWNSGYGIFDGFAFKGVVNQAGELFDYIDKNARIVGMLDQKGHYLCLVNNGSEETFSGCNEILYYSFGFNSWFRIKEWNVSGLWLDRDDVIVGTLGNIAYFDGGDGAEFPYVLEIAPSGLEIADRRAGNFHKELVDLYALIGSTGDYTYTVEVFTDENLVEAEATGSLSARLTDSPFKEVDKDSVWDEAILDQDARWVAPKANWSRVLSWSNPAQFYTFRVRFMLPFGARGEFYSLQVEYNVEDPQPGV